MGHIAEFADYGVEVELLCQGRCTTQQWTILHAMQVKLVVITPAR